MGKFLQRDFTTEATALFTRFVERHTFTYEVERDAPVEVLWRIPAQMGLSLPITLGLQNWDELNFGVEDFWSYFFPFDDSAEAFERMLNDWTAGNARIGVIEKRGRILQIKDEDAWATIYKADVMPFFTSKPKAFIYNDPNYSNSTIT